MSSYTISVTLYFSLQYFIRVTDVHTQRREPLFASRKHPPPLQKVGKTAGVILCGQILSLHAAATISGHNLWLDVVKHQLPIVYYIFQYITVKDIGW